MSYRVVFVCTGNRCRSPYAENRLRQLTDGLPVEVTSVGTLNAPGMPVPDELVQLAARSRVDLARHSAIALAGSALEDADLVIGFELSHVAAAVVDGGVDRTTSFVLPELTRLLQDVPDHGSDDVVERAREMVRRADEMRRVSSFSPRREIADPFGGPRRAYEQMVAEVDRHLKMVASGLFGVDA